MQTRRLNVASQQDEPTCSQNLTSDPSEVDPTDAACVQLGRTGGPPRPRTNGTNLKQWQPPKNESTPSKRPQRE